MSRNNTHKTLLSEASRLIKPYFEFSCHNVWRITGSVMSVVLIPALSVGTTFLIEKFTEEDSEKKDDVTGFLTSAVVVSGIYALQKSFSYAVTLSLQQAMKGRNTRLLLEDEACALLNAEYIVKKQE